MKKKFIYFLACALALPLIAGCSDSDEESSSLPPTPPTPPAPATYNVILDPKVGHIEVEGKRTGLLVGEAVDLTIRAIDNFNLVSERFRLYQNSDEKTAVEYTWAQETGKLSFTMPSIDVVFTGAIQDPEYDIVLDQYTHLDAGDVEVNGVKFHFDEQLINENCETGFIEMKPYAKLYLESYLPGIERVFVTRYYDGQETGTDKGINIASSSTPNCVEGGIGQLSLTTHFTDLSLDQPYFMIVNGSTPSVITSIKLNYTPNDVEKDLKELIQVEDLKTTFDPVNPFDPYDVNPLDESKIPSNRIVEKIEPLLYTEPGEYLYGYEVYSKTSGGDKGKLLYTSKATVKLAGSAQLKHWAIFHLKDSVEFIQVSKNKKVDISSNVNVSKYNWDTPFNDFDTPFTSDRHFYPLYSVVGLPNNKNGDGCDPMSYSYNGFDGHIDMPNPHMMLGYTFGGWYLDQECLHPFDPEGKYSGDLVLYAQCRKEVKSYRRVYYYDYDGTMLNRIDLLEEKDDASLTLPSFSDVGTQLHIENFQSRMYELRLGATRVAMLRPAGEYPIQEHYDGDTLRYVDIKDYAGDIKLIVSRTDVYANPLASYTLMRKDTDQDPDDHNYVATGFTMDETYHSGDRILDGRYPDWNEDYTFDYSTYYDVQRCNQYSITDEVDGYIIDQGSYNSIATYGYGNKQVLHSKPLEGILRHDSVVKVNRRAFFNRYGLKGTYFPKNALEFDLESYANTHFNGRLLLPKNLSKIGPRAFVGSTNIQVICLPKSLSSVGKGAFSLADYNEEGYTFENLRYREGDEKILFYYEGSEKDFKKLDDASKLEITSNASKIIFNTSYTPYYGR